MIDPSVATTYHLSMRQEATDEQGAVPVPAAEAPAAKDNRVFLQAARRNLTEEEASSPAGRRWLIYDLERSDRECTALHVEIRELRQAYVTAERNYNDARVQVEKLKGEKKISKRNEVLTYLCSSAGAAGLGVAPGYFAVAAAHDMAVAATIGAGILLLAGIFLRMLP